MLLCLPPTSRIIRHSFPPKPTTIPYDCSRSELSEEGENVAVDRRASIAQKLLPELIPNANHGILLFQPLGCRFLYLLNHPLRHVFRRDRHLFPIPHPSPNLTSWHAPKLQSNLGPPHPYTLFGWAAISEWHRRAGVVQFRAPK